MPKPNNVKAPKLVKHTIKTRGTLENSSSNYYKTWLSSVSEPCDPVERLIESVTPALKGLSRFHPKDKATIEQFKPYISTAEKPDYVVIRELAKGNIAIPGVTTSEKIEVLRRQGLKKGKGWWDKNGAGFSYKSNNDFDGYASLDEYDDFDSYEDIEDISDDYSEMKHEDYLPEWRDDS